MKAPAQRNGEGPWSGHDGGSLDAGGLPGGAGVSLRGADAGYRQ